MRRSPELVPLSREHHVALEIALALRRATADTVERTGARYLEFMASDGASHFGEEEAVLVPALEGELADRLLRDHADLRAATQALAAHVRFEERIVFPHLEATLPSAELATIGRRLAAG